MKRWLGAVLLTMVAGAQAELFEPRPDPRGNPDAAATLVVYNEKDSDARSLARFYAEKRGIPAERIIGLWCPVSEEISRDDYDRTIAEPLRREFTSNFWWRLREPDSPLGPVESNKIRFIALIRGMPLKIAPAANYPGDRVNGQPPIGDRNDAAVDSELAALGLNTRLISGPLMNPYFRSYARIADAQRPELMLVCRLDGPSTTIIKRMITDAIATEENGLVGLAYVDGRGLKPERDAGLVEGDEWMLKIAENERRKGMPVVLDTGPEMFPTGYPMARAALYYGWYSQDVSGPFTQPDFAFSRGAVAVHIHSFSASTVRDAQHGWVGPLLYAGAAATLGNVYEPYLTLTAHLDVLDDRLRAGFTFAEAAYMSQRAVSWMTTCVGDPLYRPFKGAAVGEARPETGEWAEYRAGAREWFGADRPAGAASLKAAGKRLHSGIIMEGLGLLQLAARDRVGGIASFQEARRYYTEAADVTRVAIHEIIQLRDAGRDAESRALARKMIAAFPKSSAVEVLRMFDPPPPTPVPVATPPGRDGTR